MFSQDASCRQRLSTYHAGHTPDIGTGSPLATQDDLGRSVLACLDVVGEVVRHPTRIAQIGNLYIDDGPPSFPLLLIASRAAAGPGLIQGNTRDLLGKNIAGWKRTLITVLGT